MKKERKEYSSNIIMIRVNKIYAIHSIPKSKTWIGGMIKKVINKKLQEKYITKANLYTYKTNGIFTVLDFSVHVALAKVLKVFTPITCISSNNYTLVTRR